MHRRITQLVAAAALTIAAALATAGTAQAGLPLPPPLDQGGVGLPVDNLPANVGVGLPTGVPSLG